MIIRDKQDLRKCVKQSVRRAEIIETGAALSVLEGGYGISAWLSEWTDLGESLQETFDRACGGSPFADRPAALLAAVDAMHLPVHDLDKAEAIITGYDQAAYLSSVFSSMRARRVLVRVPVSAAEATVFSDERCAPLLVADAALFAPGRYGTDYAQAARLIEDALRICGAKDVAPECFDAAAIGYCLIPVCEDTGAVLHIHVNTREQLGALEQLLGAHPQLRALASADAELEQDLIRCAANMKHVLVQLTRPESSKAALMQLGARFMPYTSKAASPEEMLGSWVRAKEVLWQAMYEAYLPLARTGFELTRERIEADVEELFCGCFIKLYESSSCID